MTDPKQSFEDGLETIKALTKLSQADFDTLKEVAPQAREWANEIAQVFYDTLFEHKRTASVFKDGERPMREETLISWYHSILDANDDENFWKAQGRIGFAHIRRHINNEFMIGMAARVRDVFQAKSIETFGAERGVEVAQAFGRVLSAVVGLTAEGYDVMSQIAFDEATGAGPELVDRLIQENVDDIQRDLFG